MRACVRSCMRACVRACLRACVRACTSTHLLHVAMHDDVEGDREAGLLRAHRRHVVAAATHEGGTVLSDPRELRVGQRRLRPRPRQPHRPPHHRRAGVRRQQAAARDWLAVVTWVRQHGGDETRRLRHRCQPMRRETSRRQPMREETPIQ